MARALRVAGQCRPALAAAFDFEPAQGQAAFAARPRRIQQDGQNQGPHPRRDESSRRRGSRIEGRRRRAPVQRPRRVPGRLGDRSLDPQGRRQHEHRRMVRPGGRIGSQLALQARKPERADARQGNLKPRARTLGAHLPDRNRAFQRPPARGHRPHAAGNHPLRRETTGGLRHKQPARSLGPGEHGLPQRPAVRRIAVHRTHGQSRHDPGRLRGALFRDIPRRGPHREILAPAPEGTGVRHAGKAGGNLRPRRRAVPGESAHPQGRLDDGRPRVLFPSLHAAGRHLHGRRGLPVGRGPVLVRSGRRALRGMAHGPFGRVRRYYIRSAQPRASSSGTGVIGTSCATRPAAQSTKA